MDNKQFELVTLFNPLAEPYTIVYNKEPVRTIQPGQSLQVVRMWAENGAKHICDALMRKDGVSLLDKDKRATYMARVWIAEEGSLLQAAPSENERANQLINQHIAAQNPASNAGNWKFDPLTGQPLQPATTTPIPQPQPEIPLSKPTFSNPEVANVMGNIPQGTGERPAQDLTVEEAPVLQDKSNATKEQVMAWIRGNLPVNIDEPEVAARLAAMSVEELKTEYRYNELA